MSPRARPRVIDLGEGSDSSASDQTRRAEILQTAATLIAESGLRTSLQQIADAAGILPGSLYHHFESKEAILVELMRQFHVDMERLAATARQQAQDRPDASVRERIADFAEAISEFAVAHRAALQMSFYEGPSSNADLAELAQRRPVVLQQAMLEMLQAGRERGEIRSGLDLPTLADRFCQTMLHVGLDVIRSDAPTGQVARVMSSVTLDGLAIRDTGDTELDRSTAFAAADAVVRSWSEEVDDPDDKAAHVRAVAKAEFGRRGFEVTTVREIASAAGLATGTVYRLIGSKDELLMAIMRSFGEKVGGAWIQVLTSDATPLEKLDALSWLNINALDRFADEFRIQLAWMRVTPPDAHNPAWAFALRLKEMKSLLSQGIRSGEIRRQKSSLEVVARCIIGIQWIPENILSVVGPRTALVHARDTVIRGIAARA